MSAAAPVTCSVGQSLKERDGGEGQPVAQTPEDTQSQDRELVELLKECASTLGVTSSQDGTPKAKGKAATHLSASNEIYQYHFKTLLFNLFSITFFSTDSVFSYFYLF